jgi:hypothetical protein
MITRKDENLQFFNDFEGKESQKVPNFKNNLICAIIFNLTQKKKNYQRYCFKRKEKMLIISIEQQFFRSSLS